MIDKNIIFDIVNNIKGSLLITDTNSKIVYSNNHFINTFGFNQNELLHQKPSILKSLNTCNELYKDIKLSLCEDGQWQGEIWNKSKNGNTKPYWVIINEVRDNNNNLKNYFAMYIDMHTKNKNNLYKLAHYDELTGLPNRILLNKTLQRICSTKENGTSAILFLDIDNFKNINDKYGHIAGDYTLKKVASIIESTIRVHDNVARVSGDEFVICLNNIKNREDIDFYAKRLLERFKMPLEYKNKKLNISLSIGISMYPTDTVIQEELINFSDQAMYEVKKNGKNNFKFFSE